MSLVFRSFWSRTIRQKIGSRRVAYRPFSPEMPDSLELVHPERYQLTNIKTISGVLGFDYYECYSLLCQCTHPTAHSVLQWFVLMSGGNRYALILHSEKEQIENLINEYRKATVPLLAAAINPAIACLKCCYL